MNATTESAWTIEPANGWPYPRASVIRKQGQRVWLEISEEHADQLLEAVPPILLTGGFMVGEPHDYDLRRNADTYGAVANFGARYFLAIMTRSEWDEARAALAQLLQA